MHVAVEHGLDPAAARDDRPRPRAVVRPRVVVVILEVPVPRRVLLVERVMTEHDRGGGANLQILLEPVQLGVRQGAADPFDGRVLRVEDHDVIPGELVRLVVGRLAQDRARRGRRDVEEVVIAPGIEDRHPGRLQHPPHVAEPTLVGVEVGVVDAVAHVHDEIGVELGPHPAREPLQQFGRGAADPDVHVGPVVNVRDQSDPQGHRFDGAAMARP